jgi:hypothetical protein
MASRSRQRVSAYLATVDRCGIAGPPIDDVIDRVPSVRRADRRVDRLAARLGSQVSDRGLWIAYSEARMAQRIEREARFFDSGYGLGIIAGQAASGELRRDRGGRALREKLRLLVVTAAIPDTNSLAALLQTALGLIAWMAAAPVPHRERPTPGRDGMA